MTRIEIEQREINATQETVFAYLSDFNNFEELMPDSVTNWQSSTDNCSFKMQGLAKIAMRMSERVPHSSIFIKSEGESPFDFTLTIHIDPHDNHALARLIFEAEINMFMRMIVEKSLGSFFGYISKQLQLKYQ